MSEWASGTEKVAVPGAETEVGTVEEGVGTGSDGPV